MHVHLSVGRQKWAFIQLAKLSEAAIGDEKSREEMLLALEV